jgi:hypothetical protein
MYCPNCAAPIDGVKFCRSCGSNVSLVPQAMSGELPKSDDEDGRHWGHHHWDWGHHHGEKEPSIERATTKFFSGVGFLLAAMFVCFYFPGGFTWGWAFLFPAFALIGQGVGHYLRLKEQGRKQMSFNQPVVHREPAQAVALSAPTTSELVKPSSVTEDTTRHLESSRQRE